MQTEAQTTNRYDEMLRHAEEHRAADMLLKGTYASGNHSNFKGCSVGCFVHSIKPAATVSQIYGIDNKHALVAEHYGYPEWLARLQDTVFEGLPEPDNRDWHVQLSKALQARGDTIDWQHVLHAVHVGILRISYRTAGEAAATVQDVIDLHERAMRGDLPKADEWSAAESAARSAAESAAESAARSAARSAAWSARSAAESAAWSAWSAGSARSARSAAYQDIRDVILDALVLRDDRIAA